MWVVEFTDGETSWCQGISAVSEEELYDKLEWEFPEFDIINIRRI